MRVVPVLFFLFVILSAAESVRAAACCGPTASLPSLLSSGERWKVQAGLSQTTTIADVGSNGEPVFRREQDRRQTSLMTFDAVAEIRENWQIGVSTGQSTRDGRAADLSLQLIHESWPEHESSWGLLRVFTFAQVTFPTGRALEEIQDLDEDPTGEGRGSGALGAVFIRRGWDDDQFVSARVRRFNNRDFDQGVSISSSWKSEVGAGAGKTWGPWRGGVAVKAEHESSRDVSSSAMGASQAGENYRFPASFSASYFFVGGMMLQVQYTDETLIGPVRNILLGRTFGLTFSQRFY